MHVLILTDGYPNPYVKAQGVFVRDQALALARSGLRVGVIACVPVSVRDVWKVGLSDLIVRRGLVGGVQEVVSCFVQIPRWYMYPVLHIAQLGLPLVAAYIAENGMPDIIHVHGFHSGKLALSVRENWRIPVIVTEHNSRFLSGAIDKKRLRFAGSFFERADFRIAVSKIFKERLEHLFPVSFDVIPNTVDTDLFKPGKRANEFLFFCAARFDDNKNQRLQIEAFSCVAQQMPEARLWLAGEGHNKQGCIRLIESLGLKEKVRLTNFLEREEMIAAMQQSSVYLITSARETFGVVAIEAMSCGMRVISTPCGGPEETLKDVGRIAQPTPEDFAAAMLEEYNLRGENDSNEMHSEMVAHFSYNALSASLRQVYSRFTKTDL